MSEAHNWTAHLVDEYDQPLAPPMALRVGWVVSGRLAACLHSTVEFAAVTRYAEARCIICANGAPVWQYSFWPVMPGITCIINPGSY
jgi:hypothetical protein